MEQGKNPGRHIRAGDPGGRRPTPGELERGPGRPPRPSSEPSQRIPKPARPRGREDEVQGEPARREDLDER
jgi:hypothetical protein